MSNVLSESPRTPEEMSQQLDKWLNLEDGFSSSGPYSVEQSIHAGAYVTVTRHGNGPKREYVLTWGRTRVKMLDDGTETGSYGNEAKPFTALFNDIADELDRTRPQRQGGRVGVESSLVLGRVDALTRS